MTVRQRARRAVKPLVPGRLRQKLKSPRPPWVLATQEPGDPRPPLKFGFYALVGTWMEEDVIADTVQNAFAQGVDRVFLVDNGSPDATVQRAVSAGAEDVLSYRTETFDESYRYVLMNELVHHISRSSGLDHVWWLWLDADEFPRAQSAETLKDRLERLDRSYRVVGARVLNHYPTPGELAFAPGQHPAEVQPLCEEVRQHICDAMHRKHPLQRWDRAGARIDSGWGFHRVECVDRPLLEPLEPIVVHHVPYRQEERTRHRLDVLWYGREAGSSRAAMGDIATDHMQARAESVDAVYRGDWGNVRNFIPGHPERGVELTDWRDLRPLIDPVLPRWGTGTDADDG